MYKKTAILMLFFALLIPVGCSQRTEQKADLDDQVESRLDNQNLKDVDAKVTQDGTVELTGTVENEQQKALAEQTAKGVSGVSQVNNLIKVNYEESGNASKDIDIDRGKIDRDKDGGVENVSERSNDSWISFKTKLALYANDKVAGHDINVESKNGVVTLIGKVPNADAKNTAIQVAQGIDGVKKVNDQLQVVPASLKEVVADKDDNITNNINAALKKEPGLNDLDLTVNTNNGVVTLTGEADNMNQLDKAIQVARHVKGVKAVNAQAVEIENKGVNKQAKDNKGSY
jgi:hyperosmotically inducible periplasmic protein